MWLHPARLRSRTESPRRDFDRAFTGPRNFDRTFTGHGTLTGSKDIHGDRSNPDGTPTESGAPSQPIWKTLSRGMIGLRRAKRRGNRRWPSGYLVSP